jgi:hypothetical protein
MYNSNPKEKIFLLCHYTPDVVDCKKLINYIENDLSSDISDRTKFIHWRRDLGGSMYLMGTCENTVWTVDKIISKIKKNVGSNSHIFVVEIQDRDCQGLMDKDFWNYYIKILNLTSYIDGIQRSKKLKKIKELIDKKEELKRKENELKIREFEIRKKNEIINEEEELLKKEELIKKQEEELLKKEKELKKRKKFLGIF